MRMLLLVCGVARAVAQWVGRPKTRSLGVFWWHLMQDSTRHWTLHAVVDRDEQMKTLFERTIGIPLRYDMLACNPWRQTLLLADSYGRGRVLLAGDAVQGYFRNHAPFD